MKKIFLIILLISFCILYKSQASVRSSEIKEGNKTIFAVADKSNGKNEIRIIRHLNYGGPDENFGPDHSGVISFRPIHHDSFFPPSRDSENITSLGLGIQPDGKKIIAYVGWDPHYTVNNNFIYLKRFNDNGTEDPLKSNNTPYSTAKTDNIPFLFDIKEVKIQDDLIYVSGNYEDKKNGSAYRIVFVFHLDGILNTKVGEGKGYTMVKQ